MSRSWKDASRTAWSDNGGNNTGSDITDARMTIGTLQRIADATELMAKNHEQLIAELDRYLQYYTESRQIIDRLHRRISALRGVVTRLKKERAT